VTALRKSNADGWSKLITGAWRRGFDAVIETGRLLTESKAELEHGEWLKMAETLPFKRNTAERLMAIAADERITNRAHAPLLPPAWTTLYELTKLDDQQFEAKIADGSIRPDMERQEIISGSRAMMGSRLEPKESRDFLPTPPWATRALIEIVLPHLGVKKIGAVWEPASGEGHMAEVLEEYTGVLATDKFADDYRYGSKFDFLGNDEAFEVEWIVTNPPFEERAEAFTLRALKLATVGVAMFLPLRWLETIGRYERLFRDRPPTLISFFAERVNLCKGEWKPNGSTATAYIWLVWIKGRTPRPPFWIPPGQREALTHADDDARFTTHPVTKKNHPNDADQHPRSESSEPAPEGHPSLGPDAGAGSPISELEEKTEDPLDIPTFLKRNKAEPIDGKRSRDSMP